MPTINLGLPLITGNQSADVVRDMNALAEEIDLKVASTEELATHKAETAKRTTENLTFYVNDSTGSDTNDGLTSATAFKTVNAAILKIPQVINHNVVLNIAAGTYNENIIFEGYAGKAILSLNCSGLVTINGTVQALNSVMSIRINDINEAKQYVVAGVLNANIKKCKTTNVDNSISGFVVASALVTITECVVSNKLRGIDAIETSIVHSFNNSGTNNTTGLRAVGASTIGKQSAQPIGTTAESVSSGGVIR